MHDSEPTDKDLTAFYLVKLLQLFIRLHDLASISYYPYFQPDLPSVNRSLIDEIKKQLSNLNNSEINAMNITLPYENYNLDDVIKTWLNTERPRIHHLQLKLETDFLLPGVNNLPKRQLNFLFNIEKRLDNYENARNRFNADSFYRFFESQRNQRKLETQQRDQTFPFIDFDFIENEQVKIALLSYYGELKEVYYTDSIKSSIIMTGAIIEALLKEALKLEKEKAKEECKNTADIADSSCSKEIENWRFCDIIDISLGLNILPKDIETQMDAIRNFRNFVHIHRAVSSGVQLDNNYKEICKSALFIVINHVRKWFEEHSSP